MRVYDLMNKLLFTDHLLYARHYFMHIISFIPLRKSESPQVYYTQGDTYPHNNHCEKQYTNHVLPFLP